MPLALIVDDDLKIVSVIRLYLGQAGFETAEAYDGAAALDLFERLSPDLVILDWMLPRQDGLSVLQRIRQHSGVPVLMLTARVAVDDRVRGLETGADDYLVKPFHPQELVARARTLLRRTGQARAGGAPEIRVEGLTVDPLRHRVMLGGQAVPALTAIEFRILHALAERPEQVCTREFLVEQIYSFGEKYILDRTIDAHIAKIRSKLREVDPECDLIQTVRGVGYRLAAASSSA
jgi:DNA-binding response OmpR family regulator